MPNIEAVRRKTIEIPRLSSDQQVIYKVESEFQRAFDVQRKDHTRLFENFGAYHGVDGLQWENALLKKLNSENRAATQFNIVQAKVDTLAGALNQEKFDLDWMPINGVRNSLTESIRDTWYADSELCDFESQMERVIIDGLIMEGCLKMYMNDKYNPLKNIAFKRCTPGFIVKDPYWVSDDDDDLERLWEIFHISAQKIQEIYNIDNPQINNEIAKWQQLGGTYYENLERDPNSLVRQQFKGHLHRVIEFHWMENINRTRLYGKKITGVKWLPFPITTEPAALEHFMIKYKIDPMTIREGPYRDRIHHVTTICPTLSPGKVLTNGISELQPKRLPYYFFSGNRAFGQAKGTVDDIIDAQRAINKRESKITDLINTANGGGKLVNKHMFSSPEEAAKFEKEANNPSYIGLIDGDEMVQNKGIHYINSNNYPSQIFENITRMYDTIDKISKVPPTMDAVSENSNESGVLFARKLQVSKIGLVTTIRRVKNLRKKVGVGYFEQWGLAYNGPERSFTTSDGKYNATLNKRVYSEEEGKVYIENRPDQVPRCMVIITEAPNSPNKMLRDRELFAEYYKYSLQGNKQYADFFFHKLAGTLELSEDDKEELNVIKMMQRIENIKTMEASMAGLDASKNQALLISMQSMMTMQQLSGGGQQQQPQGQGQIPTSRVPAEDVEEGDFDEAPIEDLPSLNEPEPLTEGAPLESPSSVQI